VQGYSKSSSVLEPLAIYRSHTAVVEVRLTGDIGYRFLTVLIQDVAWHATNANVFASVGDDRMLML
jgi:histone-binding protein RBBP4